MMIRNGGVGALPLLTLFMLILCLVSQAAGGISPRPSGLRHKWNESWSVGKIKDTSWAYRKTPITDPEILRGIVEYDPSPFSLAFNKRRKLECIT